MEDDKKTFDKAKYLKTVRAKEQQLNFKRNFESEGDDIARNAQLNSKYRDRAQERKVGQIDANDDSDGEYGYLENEDDNNGNGLLEQNEEHIKKHGLAFADEKDQFQLSENVVRLKGLDYSLLSKELQKTKEANKIEKAAAAKTIASIKESLSNAQKKKEPSEFAKRIMRVLDQNSGINHGQNKQSKRVPFPIPCSYYEYEIPSTSVLSELPSVVLKEKSIDEQKYVIPVVGSDALDSLSRIINIYSLKGKKGLKEERERLQKLQEEQQKQAMDVEDDQNIFEDADESIFEKNQKESNQILQEEKDKKQPSKDDDQDIFEDIIDYKQALIEEQKREFLRQKADNILNSRNSEHQKMGGRVGMNDKRSNPFEEKVEYDECFPKMAPNIMQMKEMREREKLFTVAEPYKKNKKEIFGRKLAAVERVIKEKQDMSKKQS